QDKEAIRRKELQCLQENRRLVQEKANRKIAEEEEEARFAEEFRMEGEAYAADGATRERERREAMKTYGRQLKAQMRATSAMKRVVLMTNRER
ncbi:unnamed protein product, partial [Discosporangium mesarthrocarpum]